MRGKVAKRLRKEVGLTSESVTQFKRSRKVGIRGEGVVLLDSCDRAKYQKAKKIYKGV